MYSFNPELNSTVKDNSSGNCYTRCVSLLVKSSDSLVKTNIATVISSTITIHPFLTPNGIDYYFPITSVAFDSLSGVSGQSDDVTVTDAPEPTPP